MVTSRASRALRASGFRPRLVFPSPQTFGLILSSPGLSSRPTPGRPLVLHSLHRELPLCLPSVHSHGECGLGTFHIF